MTRYSVDNELNDLSNRQKAVARELGSKTVTLLGMQFTGKELAQMCAQEMAADEQVDKTNRAWRAAVAERDALRGQNAKVFAALKSYVQATYGKSSQMVAEFGYKPAEAAVKSVEVKAAAVVKLRATRSARHTMGRKQRQGIKGAVQASPSLVPAPRSVSSS